MNDDAYYDGDLQMPESTNIKENIDCSIQCPPHWTEPVLQQQQALVFPTSASVSLKCSFHAKPKAKVTWLKDGHPFSPELQELVSR